MDLGIALSFDAATQTLRLIEVYDFARLTLHYHDTDFRCAVTRATAAAWTPSHPVLTGLR